MTSTAHAATDSDRAAEYVLNLPSESAARAAAKDLAALGHLLVAVRVADERARAWERLPAGWWQARTVAATVGGTTDARHWAYTRVLIHVEAVARRHGGFARGVADRIRESALLSFDRTGLVYEAPAGSPMSGIATPVEVVAPPSEEPVPGWTCGESPTNASELVDAVHAVAQRLYGDADALPEDLNWLFDEDDFDSPLERHGAFWDMLCDGVSSDGQGDDVTADLIPFAAALAADAHVPAGIRGHFLHALLVSATSAYHDAVEWADRALALGESTEESADERAVRLAVVAQVPRLLDGWDTEVDACRLLLAALATLAPESATFVEPRLADLPAPAGTRRADLVALVRALLHDDGTGSLDLAEALDVVARWEIETAICAAGPADRRSVALARLPELIFEESGPTTYRTDGRAPSTPTPNTPTAPIAAPAPLPEAAATAAPDA